MTIKHGFKYRGFTLGCDPMPLADGRFSAQVVIGREEGGQHVDRSFPALPEFPTEAEAVQYAKEWGKRWVDDHC
jgi:hypothetical protein